MHCCMLTAVDSRAVETQKAFGVFKIGDGEDVMSSIRYAPFAEVGLLDEAHRGQDGADVVQAPLNCNLRLSAPSRRHVSADQRHRCFRQRDGALQ